MILNWLIQFSTVYAYNAAGMATVLLIVILIVQVSIEAYGGKVRQRMGGILYLAILPLLLLLGITSALRVVEILRALL